MICTFFHIGGFSRNLPTLGGSSSTTTEPISKKLIPTNSSRWDLSIPIGFNPQYEVYPTAFLWQTFDFPRNLSPQWSEPQNCSKWSKISQKEFRSKQKKYEYYKEFVYKFSAWSGTSKCSYKKCNFVYGIIYVSLLILRSCRKINPQISSKYLDLEDLEVSDHAKNLSIS